MDDNTSLDQLRVAGNISCKRINKLDDDSAEMETNNIDHLVHHSSSPSPSMAGNGGFDLSPVTPDLNNENSQLMSCFTSPLTSLSSPMLAPLTMKHLEESRSYVARKLDYNLLMTHNDWGKPLEDDMLLEAAYDSLLECIMSKQAEDIFNEISAVDSSSDELTTPRSAPRLNGIVDTCPGPPLKSVKKSRNIDVSLCRRLEFDFEV